jgi:hypothetical protein
MTDIEEVATDAVEGEAIESLDDLMLVKKMQDGRDQIVTEIKKVIIVVTV